MAVDNFFEGSDRKRKRGVGAAKRGRDGASAGSRGGKGNGRAMNNHNDRPNNNYKGKGREEVVRVVNGDDEDLNSDEDADEDDAAGSDDQVINDEEFESEDEAERKETPAQKRLRLAQQYLDSLKAAQQDQIGFDAADLERDLINERLQKDVLEVSGKLHLRIADKLAIPSATIATTSNRAHRLPVTAAIATEDCRYLFTASKDGSIARWDISSFSSSSSSSSSTSTSASTLTNGSSSGQPEASTSTSTSTPHPKITKLDFIPKRVLPKRRTKADSKGKAVIARNQPSQDSDTPGHTDEIFTLAISGDGTRLASGGKDRRIGVWDISSQSPSQGCRWLSGLRGHKDTIASLRFRLGTSQLYTSSFDRTVKIYDIASLAYIETLFGHQDKIQDVAVLKNELAVTAGGRDKTLRYWKIKDETQLVFRAGGTSKIRSVLEGGLEDVDNEEEEADADEEKKKINLSTTLTGEKKFVEGSVDCTTMIDDTHFVSGGDSGTLSLWNVNKKKPIFSIPIAHGLQSIQSSTEGVLTNPRWIVSLASLPFSDVFVSGSWDGSIRFWKISEDIKSFASIGSIHAKGYVNSLQMIQVPTYSAKTGTAKKKHATAIGAKMKVMIVAALGQEHKFGRWNKVNDAKNQALLALIQETS